MHKETLSVAKLVFALFLSSTLQLFFALCKKIVLTYTFRNASNKNHNYDGGLGMRLSYGDRLLFYRPTRNVTTVLFPGFTAFPTRLQSGNKVASLHTSTHECVCQDYSPVCLYHYTQVHVSV